MIGVVLVLLAALLWLNRRTAAREILVGWLDRRGVAAQVDVERLELDGFVARVRIGDPRDPDVSIERVLASGDEEPFIEKSSKADTPILVSEDGKMRLAIIGWLKTIEWLQWYDVQSEPGGVLDSDSHQRGSVECLSVLEGEFEVEVGGVTQQARAGESLRYRCDRPHTVRCLGTEPAKAVMVVIMKAAVME